MSQPVEDFLDQCLPLPGILACVVRLPDLSLITRRDGDALSTAQAEKTLNRLMFVDDILQIHAIKSRSLCWTFEQGRIHLTRRPDGALMAVFSENQPGQPPNDAALYLGNAFLELSAV